MEHPFENVLKLISFETTKEQFYRELQNRIIQSAYFYIRKSQGITNWEELYPMTERILHEVLALPNWDEAFRRHHEAELEEDQERERRNEEWRNQPALCSECRKVFTHRDLLWPDGLPGGHYCCKACAEVLREAYQRMCCLCVSCDVIRFAF